MVSIIIPLYNVENYVVKSLKSALAQTYSDIEYLLIDDCSTDHTMQVVREYLSNHPRREAVRIIHHDKNLGLSAARNTGLSNVMGEYIYFMDSDDEIVPDCIELHYNAIQLNKGDFTVSNIQLEGKRSVHIKPIKENVENQVPILSLFRKEWNISACNKLYKLDFVRKNNLMFGSDLIHEDILWSYQLALYAKKVTLVKEATYKYMVHEGSITTKKNGKRKIDSLLYILSYIRKDFEEREALKCYSKSFYRMYDSYRLMTGFLLLNYDGSDKNAKSYYTQLSGLGHKSYNNIYSIMLKFPFGVYKCSLGLLYRLYKHLQ
jgi:glycosyltransferase involved in cell wall biosynthesis